MRVPGRNHPFIVHIGDVEENRHPVKRVLLGGLKFECHLQPLQRPGEISELLQQRREIGEVMRHGSEIAAFAIDH